ncbi:hypothetical protein EN920_34440, partial [Mesorhizobium sp. M7A.F.Ca.CA.004.09.1.2]
MPRFWAHHLAIQRPRQPVGWATIRIFATCRLHANPVDKPLADRWFHPPSEKRLAPKRRSEAWRCLRYRFKLAARLPPG